MRRSQLLFVLCVAFMSIIGAQRSAAQPYQPYESVPLHNWRGFYLGANLGGTWGSTTASSLNGFGVVGDFWSAAPSGFTGGVQLGYNWQIGPVLYGIEGDLGDLGLAGSATTTFIPFTYDTSTSTDMGLDLTLRGRLGVLFNQWLLYATGGYIGADTTASVVNYCTSPPCSLSYSAQNSSFRNGWTVGGGFETVLSGQWTFKVEYLYFDFGSVNVAGVASGIPYNWHLSTDGSLVRVGINYQFAPWNFGSWNGFYK